MKTDVFVIGAGIAGLTAGVYSLRYGMNVYLCDSGFAGGQISLAPKIENYPGAYGISGDAFCENLATWYTKNGGTIQSEKVISIEKINGNFLVKTDKNEILTKTVIAANGAKRRSLGCIGEDKFIGKGISWCAQCDGTFFRGKNVAVIGGGNTAVGEALHLSDLCAEVYVVLRKDAFRASPVLVEKLKEKSNITVLYSYTVNKFVGSSHLDLVELKSVRDNSIKEIEVSGVFEAIGSIADNSMFISLAEFDDTGYIITNKFCQTKTPGLYAAGDARSSRYRQLVTAASDGCIAASESYKYISGIPD